MPLQTAHSELQSNGSGEGRRGRPNVETEGGREGGREGRASRAQRDSEGEGSAEGVWESESGGWEEGGGRLFRRPWCCRRPWCSWKVTVAERQERKPGGGVGGGRAPELRAPELPEVMHENGGG